MVNTSLGYLKGFSLDSIVSMIEMDAESWTLKVNSDGRVGFLYFDRGRVVDAEAPGLTGEKAALEIISWDDAVVHIKDPLARDKTIQLTIMKLLLEGNRIKDELKAERALEAKSCDEAAAHISAFRIQEGHQILVPVLKKNPRCHRAWLWYSRVATRMQDIEQTLERGLRLAPENEELMKEKARFSTAKKRPIEGKVKRCPFCWTPLDPKALACVYCNLQLAISKLSLGRSMDDADADIIDQSVKRFSAIIENEDNVYVSYYMAVAHYNMGDPDRTLELLNDTVALSGGRAFFKDQLTLYLNWMASREISEPVVAELPEEKEFKGDEKTILVVEDSATTRKVISVTLNMKGYRVIEAVDGLEALSKLSEETPDMVLLDIILPKMNGYEILGVIKNKTEFKNLPVIMLTGRDGFISRMKGKMAGATAYITKPFQPENLLQAIEKHI